MPRNLELKYRGVDLAAVESRLGGLVTRREVQEQIDVYFRAHSGRLKLRVIEGQPAQLIWYDRSETGAVKDSRYLLAPVPDPGMTREVLSRALGERGEVRKRRVI